MTSEENKEETIVSRAINGTSDIYIANETCRRLDAELKESGGDSFTIADIRRIMKDIYEGK